MAGFSCLLVLTGCSRPKSFDSLSVRQTKEPSPMVQTVNVQGAADAAVSNAQRETFLRVVAWNQAVQPVNVPDPPDVLLPARTSVQSHDPSSPWDCIATAETGGDYSMHGSTYSTAFG